MYDIFTKRGNYESFLKYFATPLIIAAIAGGLFIVDALIGGLFATATVGEAYLLLGIILVYVLLGLVCGFLSVWGDKKVKDKLAKLEGEKDKEEK